jgi:glycosyltransferase involved in cell wall biosynthesis
MSPENHQLEQAIRAVQEGRFEIAARLLEPLAWNNDNALLWNNLGAVYMNLGWLVEAEAALRRAVKFSPAKSFVDNLVNLLSTQRLPFSCIQVLQEVAAAGAPEEVWLPRLQTLQAQNPARLVSVYTPGYASEAFIERCLRGIRAQTYPVHEILLVDDQSPDRSTEIALQNGVRVFSHSENLGLAASCNTALTHCTGDFLLKVDTDVELLPTWLERAMPAFDEKQTAGVGGWLIEHHTTTIADRYRRLYLAQHRGPVRVDNVDLFGADCVFRVSALRQVNGWNARYRTNFEDCDLSQRLRAAGFRLIYEPNSRARHLRRDTVIEVLRTQWNWFHPVVQDRGCYDSVTAAAPLIPRNRAIALNKINHAAQVGDFELTYPSFLGHFWFCLRDLQQVLRRGKGSTSVIHTVAGIFLLAELQLRGSFAIPTPVVERTIRDLKDFAERITGLSKQDDLDLNTLLKQGIPPIGDASELLPLLRKRLPAADEVYLATFVREAFFSDIKLGIGAILGLSLEALKSEERAQSLTGDAPLYVFFNPPLSERRPAASSSEAARARWPFPSAIEEMASHWRSAGARILILDAVAMRLDHQDAHERVLGAGATGVVYIPADGDLERMWNSARFLALTAPTKLRLLLARANASISNIAPCPFLQEVSAEPPDHLHLSIAREGPEHRHTARSQSR